MGFYIRRKTDLKCPVDTSQMAPLGIGRIASGFIVLMSQENSLLLQMNGFYTQFTQNL